MTEKTDPQRQAHPAAPSDQSTVTLLLTMADTTWRMFVPSIAVIGVGLWADLKFHTKPWLTLLSVPVGLTLSVLMVRRQLRGVK
jgi:hypothetical protein